MQPRYLRIDALATTPARDGRPAQQGRYPVTPSTLWRWVKAGHFPAPVKLGPQTTAWPVDVLDKWDAEQTARAGTTQ